MGSLDTDPNSPTYGAYSENWVDRNIDPIEEARRVAKLLRDKQRAEEAAADNAPVDVVRTGSSRKIPPAPPPSIVLDTNVPLARASTAAPPAQPASSVSATPTPVAGNAGPFTPGPGAIGTLPRPAMAAPTVAPEITGESVSNIGDAANTLPAVGPVLGQWIRRGPGYSVLNTGSALVKAPGNYQLAPTYEQASTDPNTGLPVAGPGLTKLGKVLTLLRAVGMGAAVGSTQPTFGTGFLASQQNQNQQAQEFQARQQGAVQTALARAQLGMVPLEMQTREAQLRAQQELLPLQTEMTRAQLKFLPLSQQYQLEQMTVAPRTDPDTGQYIGPMSQKGYEAYINSKVKGATAAQAHGASAERVALINQGQMVHLRPGEAEQLQLDPSITEMPLKQYNQAVGAQMRQNKVIQGQNDQYIMNVLSLHRQPLGVGNPRIASAFMRVVQVADPSRPGGVRYMFAGDAVHDGVQAAQSADVKIPAATLKYFTTGGGGQTLNAFNTASDHLEILQELGDALHNGDIPAINSIANKWATATGGAAPTNFNMAKDAVAGEIAKVYSSATVSQISEINQQMHDAMSPAALAGVIETARRFMNSKRVALYNQFDQAMHGQPAFPPGTTGGGGGANQNQTPPPGPAGGGMGAKYGTQF